MPLNKETITKSVALTHLYRNWITYIYIETGTFGGVMVSKLD